MRPGPLPPAEPAGLLDSFLYGPEACRADEIVRIDREAHAIEARLDTARPLPYSNAQRVRPEHPPTSLPASCVDRIHRADFRLRLPGAGPDAEADPN